MAAGLVEGGIVGAVIGKLRTSVTDMATKNILFESELGALTEILQSIEPKLLEIEKYNKELDRAEKTKPYIDLLNKGKELVERCSEISPWSFFERSLYSDELTGYKADLLRFCQVELQLEQSSDIKEMLVKLNRVSEVLDYVKGPSFVGKFFLPGSTLTDRVIVPDSTLLKRKDEVLIKDGPAAVLLAPGWFGATTSPVIQDCTDMYENIFLAKHSKMASIKCIVPELFQIKRCHETKDEAYTQFKAFLVDKEYNEEWDEGTLGSGEEKEPSPRKHEGTLGSGEGEEPNPKKHVGTLGSGEGDEPSPKKPRKH